MEGGGCGGRKLWREDAVEGGGCGGRRLWRVEVVEGGGCGGRRLWREEAEVTIMYIDQSWVRDWTLPQLIPLHIFSRQVPFSASERWVGPFSSMTSRS